MLLIDDKESIIIKISKKEGKILSNNIRKVIEYLVLGKHETINIDELIETFDVHIAFFEKVFELLDEA